MNLPSNSVNVDGHRTPAIGFLRWCQRQPWMKESSGSPSSNSHRECSGTTCMDDLSHNANRTGYWKHIFSLLLSMLIQAFLSTHFRQVYEGPTSRIVFVVVGYDLNLLYHESALAQLHPIHLYLYVRSYFCEKQIGQNPFCRTNVLCLMTSL